MSLKPFKRSKAIARYVGTFEHFATRIFIAEVEGKWWYKNKKAVSGWPAQPARTTRKRYARTCVRLGIATIVIKADNKAAPRRNTVYAVFITAWLIETDRRDRERNRSWIGMQRSVCSCSFQGMQKIPCNIPHGMTVHIRDRSRIISALPVTFRPSRYRSLKI